MRNTLKFGLTLALSLVALTACSTDDGTPDTVNNTTNNTTNNVTNNTSDNDGLISIDKLSIGFVPSRDPEEIVTATEPLKNLLQETLTNYGYDVNDVDITVGTNYEVIGEGLDAGTIDVGFIPGGTYVLYDDGADVILTATRDGLSIDSDSAKDWNDNKPTEPSSDMAVSYRSLVIAGPSAKGRELADIINSGGELTWEDISTAVWSVMSPTSPAGYIYPSIWLQENYEKTILDLPSAVPADSYGSAFARLASGQSDIAVIYADARRDNESLWTGEFGRENSIWEDVDVIGVTPAIYNDTVSVSKRLDGNFATAIQSALIDIGNTDEGREIISIYNHKGYQKAESSDYDSERQAQQFIRQFN
ncbi:MAG: phosphonate ABC transporter substrate-binding protein [Epulopiscium sp. Nele67-Bin004]|nr:MAG: phosphonate ABC transporter substrate-binding protein [Epulopiscium sp. Nele67-Bin004]